MVEGGFAVLWFSWGPPDLSAQLAATTRVGAVLGLVVLVAAALLYRTVPRPGPPADGAAVGRRYWQVVGAEFALLVVVGFALGATLGAPWAAVWVCAVVGLHFFPLARVLPGLGLVPLGVLVTGVAVVALGVGLTTDVPPTAVTGPATGALLLCAGGASLVAGRRASARG